MQKSCLKARILSASAVFALAAALNANAWAFCSAGGTITGPGAFAAFENFGTLDCVAITNHAVVNGGVTNGGVIGPPKSPQPASLSINNSTINGAIQNSGHIFASGGTPAGISVTGASVVTNGITNSGVIEVTNSSGSAVGIQVGP